MANNKLAIIGGSGLYDVEEFKKRDLLKINTPWGKPSDEILKTDYRNKEVYNLQNKQGEMRNGFSNKSRR